MAYIFVDPEGMQTMIDNLNGYSESVESHRSSAVDANSVNSHDGETPVDLSSFSSKLSEYKGELESKARGLTYRLEAARAANETGMTVTAPDGTISYYVPDDKADNADNIKSYNNVDTWRQAKADTATLVDYSENGCTVEEWEALLARMREYQDDPAYANTVTNTIGPAKVLDCVVDIQEHFPATRREGVSVPTVYAGKDLAEVFGHILAAASTSEHWTDEKATAYANALADATQEKGKQERMHALNAILSASQSVDIDGDGGQETIGLDYNDGFLGVLADRIENYKYNLTQVDNELAISEYWNSTEDPNSFSLLGIVHAMTGNPQVSTDWLTVRNDDGSVNTEATVSRTEELIKKGSISHAQGGRSRWTEDWLMLAAQNGIQGQGAVNSKENGIEQASIVSAVVNEIGGSEKNVILSDEARNSAAIALGSYPYGVHVSAQAGDTGASVISDLGVSGISAQPGMSDRALSTLVGQIGQNDLAIAKLTAAQEAFNKLQISETATGMETGQTTEDMSGTIHEQSQARGFFAGAIAQQSEISGANVDSRVGAWANVASMAISAIPLPQAKAAGAFTGVAAQFAEDFGKAAVAEGVKSGISGKNNGEEEGSIDIERARSEGISNNDSTVVLSILSSGVYTDEELRTIAKDPAVQPILNEDGSLNVNPDNSSSLTGEQKEALRHLSNRLPNKYPDISSVAMYADGSYSDGYSAAQQR